MYRGHGAVRLRSGWWGRAGDGKALGVRLENDSDLSSIEDEVDEDDAATLESCLRKNVEVVDMDRNEMGKLLTAEISFWPDGDQNNAKRTVEELVDLLLLADGGVLVVVAPNPELRRLSTQSADKGYMTKRLTGLCVTDAAFTTAFLHFASHRPELSEGDRWPQSYFDETARNQPKDGALLMKPNVFRAKCSAKVLGLPLPQNGVQNRFPKSSQTLSSGLFLGPQPAMTEDANLQGVTEWSET
jgi:hypothetical protein